MSTSREAQRLRDIIENAEAALSYVGDMTPDMFAADRKSVDATERCLERVIEASIKIGEDRMRAIVPTIAPNVLRGMGNLLRHEYDLIDPAIIHRTVVDHLPGFIASCRAALQQA